MIDPKLYCRWEFRNADRLNTIATSILQEAEFPYLGHLTHSPACPSSEPPRRTLLFPKISPFPHSHQPSPLSSSISHIPLSTWVLPTHSVEIMKFQASLSHPVSCTFLSLTPINGFPFGPITETPNDKGVGSGLGSFGLPSQGKRWASSWEWGIVEKIKKLGCLHARLWLVSSLSSTTNPSKSTHSVIWNHVM